MQPEQGHGAGLPDGRANGQLAGKAIIASQPVEQAMPLPGDPPQAGPQTGPRPGDPPQAGSGPAAPGAPQPGTAVRQAAAPGMSPSQPGEQKTFRLPGALVAWWAWLIFAVACLVDILVSGRNHLAADIAVTLVFITGVVYACALWPRVMTDSAAITVRNPLRDHRIPWGSVAAVDLRESVQVHCVREPGAKRGKIIYSWALYAHRRNRMRQQLMAQGDDRRRLPRSALPSYGMSDEASQQISKQSAAKVMATQLDEIAKEARERGAAAGPRVACWSWQPSLAIVVPGVALALVLALFH
jgi:Bacterial PH domain